MIAEKLFNVPKVLIGVNMHAIIVLKHIRTLLDHQQLLGAEAPLLALGIVLEVFSFVTKSEWRGTASCFW